MSLETDIISLPGLPGVYRYYDLTGNLLYIGKAKDLRKRVRSYFSQRSDQPARTRLMVKQIHRIEFTTVDSEKDAFLLENALIKELQPKYNIELKDDKSYPYIVIVNEAFPRIFLTRNPKKDGSEYFGPYTSVHHVRGMLELIKKLYPIRSCSLNLTASSIKKKKFKVCLEYHLGNCLGPCTALQSEADYMLNISQIRDMIKGKLSKVKSILKKDLEQLTQALHFEEADLVHKRLQFLDNYMATSSIVRPSLGDMEVFGYTEDDKKAFIHYFRIVEGTIVRVKSMQLYKKIEEEKEDLLAYAILETLGKALKNIQIIAPFEISFLANEANIHVPKSGDKKKLLDLAQKNALEQKMKGVTKTPEPAYMIMLKQLKEDLRMQELPVHIECFDNSNIQGTNPVASVVVFRNAKPSVKDYRNFNIKTVTGPDDFASMKEIVGRRYARLVEEGQPLPQLVVIDGGKGQLSAACEALEELGISGKMQVISIAKRLEEIYYPGDSLPVHISKKSSSLRILQHIRNEAHRFAITFHRKKRSLNAFRSGLSNIPGIGEKTTIALLKHFRSEANVMQASIEELANIIGKDKALKIQQAFSS